MTFLEAIGLTLVGYTALVLAGLVWAAVEKVRMEGLGTVFMSMIVLLVVASFPLAPACLIYLSQFLWS